MSFLLYSPHHWPSCVWWVHTQTNDCKMHCCDVYTLVDYYTLKPNNSFCRWFTRRANEAWNELYRRRVPAIISSRLAASAMDWIWKSCKPKSARKKQTNKKKKETRAVAYTCIPSFPAHFLYFCVFSRRFLGHNHTGSDHQATDAGRHSSLEPDISRTRHE